MNHFKTIFVRAWLLIAPLVITSTTLAKPTLEDYGKLPQLHSMDISPSGNRVAYVRDIDSERFLIVVNAKSKQVVGSVKLGDMKPRGLGFVTDNLIMLSGSKTQKLKGTGQFIELFATQTYNINKNKTVVMLGKEDRLYPGSSGSGIMRLDEDEKKVYMSAREGLYGASNSPINLYKVDLLTGKGKRYTRGTPHTLGWLLNKNNEIKARFDYHNSDQEFRLYSYEEGGKPKLIFTKDSLKPEVDAVALMADQRNLIIYDDEKIFTIDLVDGEQKDYAENEMLKPIMLKDEVLGGLITNEDEVFAGLWYTGLRPFSMYLDQERQQTYSMLRALYPNSHVSQVGQTDDKRKLLLQVSGSDMANTFLIYDRDENSMAAVASEYPNIKPSDIGFVQTIKYQARDGLTIPALLTWPSAAKTEEQRKGLPLIVLPHGGPEAHDTLRFDWWAQFLANRGYLVLQPNFRGSTGFGWDHTEAGHGRWGEEMQHDVSDGVLAMIKAGYADKDRVCIMGASYGGYSALAGATFTPELYRCAVSVNGVSDIHKMLSSTKLGSSSDHWIVRHWQQLMGESKDDKGKLKRVSPINSVEKVAAPVLIIHGDDDTVVPIVQSKIMHKALKKADKNSRFVVLKDEDHWLSRSDTRLQMVQEIDKFLKQHNPT